MSKPLPVSPLAPKVIPDLPPIAGVRLASFESAVRYRGRPDLLVMEFARGTKAAGLLTQSRMPGAPVDWCRKLLPRGSARALVVNAGNANVFTGKAGQVACQAIATAAAKAVGCRPNEVLLASTGVIGQLLPYEKIVAKVDRAGRALAAAGWNAASAAILTTDTFAKRASVETEIGGAKVVINGIAKGSGMIAPDMATLLAFVATDAALPAAVLDRLLRAANETSFNCLTVDGDTSTSDTLLLFATGQAKHAAVRDAGDPKLRAFRKALAGLLAVLAEQVARDGEGAEKLVTIEVGGAASRRAARRIALAIANSPLVKTAIAGSDANWGRIAMAVGKAGEQADRDRLEIRIGGELVTAKGGIHPGYDESKATAHLRGREIAIAVDVGIGRGKARVWTCDLTHGYININADYRS